MMKKKILAILMTALMVVSLIPMFAFTALADTHDLTVTKNDEAAVEGTDYSWSGITLTIKTDGLTVSGSTTTEIISVGGSVNNLTIKDLSITLNSDDGPIVFNGQCTLTIIGNNTITTNGDSMAIQHYNEDFTITGTGNLTTSGKVGGIYSSGNLIFDQPGTVTVSGGYGIKVKGTISFNNGIGKFIARGLGEEQAAVSSVNGDIICGDNLLVKGSLIADVDEANINGDIKINDKKIKIGDDVAKAVLIKTVKYDVKVASNIKNGKVKADKEKAAKGETVELTATPDETYKLASLKVTDADGKEVKVTDNKFVMPASNVTVTAKFTVKEEIPKTGDANNMLLWIAIALAAISLTTCTLLRVKRTNK